MLLTKVPVQDQVTRIGFMEGQITPIFGTQILLVKDQLGEMGETGSGDAALGGFGRFTLNPSEVELH